MEKNGKKNFQIIALLGIVIVTAILLWYWQSQPGYVVEKGYLAVEKAYYDHRTNIMLEVEGKVVRVLSTNVDADRYQEFIIRIETGQSLNISHDSSHSERLPLKIGDLVTVRGEYVWTETGGAIRWTHRDSSLQRRHGWIEHNGMRYD